MPRSWGGLRPGGYLVATDPPVGGITHGEQITRTTFRPTGALTPMGDVDGILRTTAPNQTFENFSCKQIRILHDGATFRNGFVLGDTTTGLYTVRHNETPHHARFEDLYVVTRDPNTKGFVSDANGATSEWRRCTFRGGEDQIFLHPEQTYASTGYAHWFEDIWAGDTTKPTGGHADCLQVDGGEGGVYVNRVNFQCFELAPGADPQFNEAPTTVEAAGNAAFILTQKSSDPDQISKVHVHNSLFDGGNWIYYTSPDDGFDPINVRTVNCRFGRTARFGSFNISPSHVSIGNRYTDGEIIPDMNA